MPSAAGEYQASRLDADKYKQVLADALLMQLKADSLGRMARDRRIHAREVPDESMKRELADEASRFEGEARLVQAEADRLFSQARKIREEDLASGFESADLVLMKSVNGIRVYGYRSGVEAPVQDKNNNAKDVSGFENRIDAKGASGAESKTDAKSASEPDIKSNAENPQELVFPMFDLLAASPYGETNPFPLLMKVEKGLVYHIQLGAFGSPAAFDEFQGIVPVFVEEISERNLFKYYAGLFTDLPSVTRALEKIRAYGFGDAFIVAYLDGRQITTEEAREIEYAEFRL